jgi:hypothetical protein
LGPTVAAGQPSFLHGHRRLREFSPFNSTTHHQPRTVIGFRKGHYKPGCDFYVVYNQGWETDLPLTSWQALEQSYRVRSRSLAVKMTYWLAPPEF